MYPSPSSVESSTLHPVVPSSDNHRVTATDEDKSNPPTTTTTTGKSSQQHRVLYHPVSSHAAVKMTASTPIDVIVNSLSDRQCGVCERKFKNTEFHSFVIFSNCKHMAHLRCVMEQRNPVQPPRQLAECSDSGDEAAEYHGGHKGSLCTRCVKLALARESAMQGGNFSFCGMASKEEMLQQCKNRFLSKTRDRYDALRNDRLKRALVCRLLCVKQPPYVDTRQSPVGSIVSKIAPSSIFKAASSALSSIREGNAGIAGSSQQERQQLKGQIQISAEAKCILKALKTGTVLKAARDVANCDFDDVLSGAQRDFPNHPPLLTAYRCGLEKLSEITDLGFHPVTHMTKSHSKAIPVWMLVDLYGMSFDFLHDEGGFNSAREVSKRLNHLTPIEWGLLGATVGELLGMGLTVDHMAKMKMKLDQWQRYLGLQREHVAALGITPDVAEEKLHWENAANHEYFQ